MGNATKHKVTTPPKGRPTPKRTRRGAARTFGSTFQWAALAVALIVLFVIAYLLLDGGDFNPFNDGAAALAALVAGAVSRQAT